VLAFGLEPGVGPTEPAQCCICAVRGAARRKTLEYPPGEWGARLPPGLAPENAIHPPVSGITPRDGRGFSRPSSGRAETLLRARAPVPLRKRHPMADTAGELLTEARTALIEQPS